MVNIRKLETELWEAADLLRADSKVTSQEYCMPVLGLIFLRYAYSRFKFVEKDILKDRPIRNGRQLPVEAADFKTKSALFLPEEARYEYLLNLPENADLGRAINHAMELIEEQSVQLRGILPKNYTILQDNLLSELLRIFNNSAFNEMKDDIIGRIYEYFLNKFAPAVASDDGVFFTPKSLVRMIVNIIEPTHGTVLDPACGSGGMFVSSADFIEGYGANANTVMTFYGQEKVDYNAKLCIMNMAVHGLNAKIVSGDEANSFYHDAHNLNGCCDYVMANPPFNVDKVKAESCENAGRLPFGMPSINKKKEVGNANYLWISYFYSYLNEKGRAGFVMASSATDSQGKDKDIRCSLIETGHVDVMISVGNNFFYTKSLPCSLWFFDKAKAEHIQDKILFIDARNYYTVVDRTLNEWSEWQLKNMNAIVWLYRGDTEKYKKLIADYVSTIHNSHMNILETLSTYGFNRINEYENAMADLYERIDNIHISSIDDGLKLKEILCNGLKAISKYKKEKVDFTKNIPKEKLEESFRYYKDTGTITLGWLKKAVEAECEMYSTAFNECVDVINEANWLYEKFGEGVYADVLGLCKVADISEIEKKGWSLTPGAYVGVAPVEDDGVDFHERMAEIHKELLELQAESNSLMDTISKNVKEMGI